MRLSPAVRKLVPVTIGVLIVLAGFGVALVYLARESISSGQRCGGQYCWGYSLDQYDLRHKDRLRFWGSWGLDIRYDLPDMNVEKINEDRWLADRAVYLNLMFHPKNDSAAPGYHVRIVYDYQRGELYVVSPLQLWRAPDYRSGNPSANWMTDSQFDAEVEALTPE